VPLRQPLEETHHVISGEADQATGERHARYLRLRPRRHGERAPQLLEQLRLGARHRQPLAADDETVQVQPDLQAIAEADEGIPREAFTALDALEQEMRPERRQLGVGRDGRVQVTCDVEWRFQNSLCERTIKNPSPV
jgi:hypothetical protein